MSVVNGITTYYASSNYLVEVDDETTTVKKTYMAGSTSIAVRTIIGEENTLNWVLGDHLGSASVTTTDDGTWFSELRYSAFGETRYSSGITPTDYRYTLYRGQAGQLEQADVNLYYYNARYYEVPRAKRQGMTRHWDGLYRQIRLFRVRGIRRVMIDIHM